MRSMTFPEALDDHFAAIATRDIERFAATISGDIDTRVIAPDGGAIVGREAIVEAHRGWFATGGWTFSPHVLFARESDGLGFALLEVDYVEDGAARRFLLSIVFLREDDTWRLLFDQNTPLA